MKTIKHTYNEVYYSDLDTPIDELENVEAFLKQHIDVKKAALVTVDPASEKIRIDRYNGHKKSLIDYVFIRSDLAGVGNYNFVLEYQDHLDSPAVSSIIQHHLQKKFFDHAWIEELITKGLARSILVTYCDGIWVELFQQENQITKC